MLALVGQVVRAQLLDLLTQVAKALGFSNPIPRTGSLPEPTFTGTGRGHSDCISQRRRIGECNKSVQPWQIRRRPVTETTNGRDERTVTKTGRESTTFLVMLCTVARLRALELNPISPTSL